MKSIAVILLACSLGSFAQTVPRFQAPTETDLLAAYCSRFFRNRASGLETGLRALSEAALAEGRESIERDHRLADRVNGYLLPRIQFLETTGLQSAVAQSDADFRAASQSIEQCTARCRYLPSPSIACSRNCLDQARAQFNTFDKCKDAAFLPY
jgi:hypothetical protein